ncbi:hypothetical protein [Moraxella sp. ZY210820]|uniref:hypothetical protein n=2 Tax=unclassified Moraxella TaxID=2685852 RepID=UPI00272F2299|nr:hypothetical protein [Moraxella sp. ZY210820]WLF83171.1 hypothetical protein LU301_07805 [Moraxella sp. ZY210820]
MMMNIKKISLILGITMAFYGCSSNTQNSPSAQDVPKDDVNTQAIIKQLSPYFSWDLKAGGEEDAPAFLGRVVMENRCLLIKHDDGRYSIPVFPDSITSWNEQKQILTVYNDEYRLGDYIFSNYLRHEPYSVKKQHQFIKQAQSQCLQEGRNIVYLGTMFSKKLAVPQGQYFAYPFEDKGEPEIQPAGWTKLENKNGCLGLSDTDLTVFPSGVTHWNAEKQVLVIREQEFKVGDWIFSNGFDEVTYDEKNPFEFAQIAEPHCLKDGMTLRVLRTQISKPSPKEMKELDKHYQEQLSK